MHVFRCQFLERGALVLVDGASDEVRLLFLQLNDSGFDRILDAQTGDDTWTLLADAVTPIGTLPFGSGIPPSL